MTPDDTTGLRVMSAAFAVTTPSGRRLNAGVATDVDAHPAGRHGPVLQVRWLTAFLDMPAETFDTGVSFWQSATGYGLSPFRGLNREFATLVPPDGDPFLRVQRIADGQAGCRLDVHVDDPEDAAVGATAVGATLVARPPGYVVLHSPAGMLFCLVDHEDAESQRPAAGRWGGGHRSLVDQLSLDIPAARYDEECAFWARLTGWQLRDGARPEFRYLDRPPGMPLRLLLQRRGDPRAAVARISTWPATTYRRNGRGTRRSAPPSYASRRTG